MENKIIIRYTWRRKSDKHILQEVVPIECLEGKGDAPFLGNELWDLVARDLYTGMTDKNGAKIFEGDKDAHGNVVEFLNGSWCLNGDRDLFVMHKTFEIIGNIHDKQ